MVSFTVCRAFLVLIYICVTNYAHFRSIGRFLEKKSVHKQLFLKLAEFWGIHSCWLGKIIDSSLECMSRCFSIIVFLFLYCFGVLKGVAGRGGHPPLVMGDYQT